MKKVLGIFLFCCLGMGWARPTQVVLRFDNLKTQDNSGQPEFYTMEWTEGTELNTQKTSLQIEMKDMGEQNVQLLLNDNETPVLYAADISTPVCADGECRLMYLRLYWNLLGKYAGYDRVLDEPLTKHDHDVFFDEDYKKLHLLLQDEHSVLRAKDVEDLVDRPQSSQISGVDAVAGATITEVKESVVEGALYSCYTAWHLVHGEVKEKIKEHTLSFYSESLEQQMLDSNEYSYQLFALERLGPDQFFANQKRIIEILRSSIPLVRSYIIKNLPEEFWKDENLQLLLWDCFSPIDINSKSLMLQYVDTASGKVLEQLSSNLGMMTKNQLKTFLQKLKRREPWNQKIIENLEAFTKSNHATYGYIVEEFIENHKN